MADVAELIRADHLRIERLFAALDDAARFTGTGVPPGSCPQRTLGTIWRRIAGLLDLHVEAEYEICCFLMFPHGTGLAADLPDAIAELREVRQAVAEANLQQPGSPIWWLAVSAARRAATRHISRIDCGVMASFCTRTDHRLRDDLGAQWAAFIAARMRDAAAPGRQYSWLSR